MNAPLVWVFVPYAIAQNRLDGETYENDFTKEDLARALLALGLPWVWRPVLVGQVDEAIAEVQRHRARGPAMVLNLCDGFDRDGFPGLSVVRALEHAGIPFTGAGSDFYDISSSKLRMKDLFVSAGVETPAHERLPRSGPVDGLCARITPPLIVKPDLASASLGITLRSRVSDDAAAAACRDELARGGLPRHFVDGDVYAEAFVDGREFAVFVVGDWRQPGSVRATPPVERVFDATLPEGERYLTCDRYWATYREESLPPSGRFFFEFAAAETALVPQLSDLGVRAYCAVRGTGYGRVDIRMQRGTGRLFALEVNANPELSAEEQTTTGYAMRLAGMPYAAWLAMLLEPALQACGSSTANQSGPWAGGVPA